MVLSKGIPALLHYLMLEARGSAAEQRLMQQGGNQVGL